MITKPLVLIKRYKYRNMIELAFLFLRASKELAWCLVTRVGGSVLLCIQGGGQVACHHSLPKKVKRAMASRWSILTHYRRSGVTLRAGIVPRNSVLCVVLDGVKRPVQVLSYDEYIEAVLATCCCP